MGTRLSSGPCHLACMCSLGEQGPTCLFPGWIMTDSQVGGVHLRGTPGLRLVTNWQETQAGGRAPDIDPM